MELVTQQMTNNNAKFRDLAELVSKYNDRADELCDIKYKQIVDCLKTCPTKLPLIRAKAGISGFLRRTRIGWTGHRFVFKRLAWHSSSIVEVGFNTWHRDPKVLDDEDKKLLVRNWPKLRRKWMKHLQTQTHKKTKEIYSLSTEMIVCKQCRNESVYHPIESILTTIRRVLYVGMGMYLIYAVANISESNEITNLMGRIESITRYWNLESENYRP